MCLVRCSIANARRHSPRTTFDKIKFALDLDPGRGASVAKPLPRAHLRPTILLDCVPPGDVTTCIGRAESTVQCLLWIRPFQPAHGLRSEVFHLEASLGSIDDLRMLTLCLHGPTAVFSQNKLELINFAMDTLHLMEPAASLSNTPLEAWLPLGSIVRRFSGGPCRWHQTLASQSGRCVQK